MQSHNPPWKSETKTLVPGAPAEFFDFVPLTGPGGGRVVVDFFTMVITGTITVATAAWDGRDVPRLFQLLTVEQRDGRQRWNLSGYKSRIASIKYNGIEQHQEHGNVAIGAAQAIDLRLIIPMSKRYARRPKDFALPADCFKKIAVSFAALANAQTGTTVLSAASLQCYVLAEWHEEGSIEIKSEDIIKSADFHSNTQCKLSTQGVVHDLDIVLENTTAGGAAVTAITDVRIEDLGIPTLTRQDHTHSYRVKRGYGASGPTTPATERFLEPVLEVKQLPVITACPETSVTDGRLVDQMKIDVGGGVAGLSAITREIVEHSQSLFQMVVAKYGLDARTVKIKTAGKTKTSLGDWGSKREQMYMPWKMALAARR